MTIPPPPWSPGLSQGLSATPECQGSSWGQHLIPAVYFWACPSAADTTLVWCVEMLSVDGSWLCDHVSAFLTSQRGSEGALSGFVPKNLRKQVIYCMVTGSQAIWPCLGPDGKNAQCAILLSWSPLYKVYKAFLLLGTSLLSCCYVPGMLGTGDTQKMSWGRHSAYSLKAVEGGRINQ